MVNYTCNSVCTHAGYDMNDILFCIFFLILSEKIQYSVQMCITWKESLIPSDLQASQPLTLSYQVGYLNFITWFMKNVLSEQKRIKLLNKLLLVENKTEIMHHAVKMQ
jgi:hypothetical protein